MRRARVSGTAIQKREIGEGARRGFCKDAGGREEERNQLARERREGGREGK